MVNSFFQGSFVQTRQSKLHLAVKSSQFQMIEQKGAVLANLTTALRQFDGHTARACRAVGNL
ncbi:MAG: hypothetical protein A2928_03300 [Candidatus Taylorbacteria bacterium RIFCSPLOWO2_01_FULL_45_15b]|uniref:Uncharacterized protein n=1 Tax=Candidatus Taylorbacteria bacterium RIFCSPLOWO2_01_FULL_45_15b TaxID=1802319 RepID=A0A1G2NFW4_9BACT|nr:MAG: hypothetical protein A2928_03300 [Candidatus Taylorbacteria bacterium RIFCSPLOWO2_01_FULL_45_15b]